MKGDSFSPRKAQLDKAEREHLEDVVAEMRDRVEDNIRFQLAQKNLGNEPTDDTPLNEDSKQLVEAIKLEAVDGETWEEALDQYIDAVGYTIINRLAALRCMEVRGFVAEEVTVFKENGLTPAAETLVHEDFLLEDEAILAAYHNTCDKLAEEIEILFDRSTAYSLVDPDNDTFKTLCGMLNEVPNEVWQADDVLGWVYEYYNVKLLDDLRRKGNREGLDPEDVPPANQFYTPHWVVRMLTDNSLGKLYLEHTGELQDVVERQEQFSPDERKNRPLSPDDSPDIADFCTYLVPSEEEGESTSFDHPSELRIIDPACGSGHFLLYAFDVLERIWRNETDLNDAEIPRKILKNNLYGVDLDMRACQLAAFNLYLKARIRTETEGKSGFDMPEIGIVCADATITENEGVEDVFTEVAGSNTDVENALRRILDSFEGIHGLGSLLDVRGTLGDLFEDNSDQKGVQITLSDDPREEHTLGQILQTLREAVDEHRKDDSFLAKDLRSFVRLLEILAQDYDVALMNPPYGAGGRMPKSIQDYVEENYQYKANFYVNFFEVCNNITRTKGRVGMIIPRSFMFRGRYTNFRRDLVGEEGGFDFLAEFGLGILDNATVRTVGTVVRNEPNTAQTGTFLRLHDIEPRSKEKNFIDLISNEQNSIHRYFQVPLSEFAEIPRSPLCYSVPPLIRKLHNNDLKLDAEQAGTDDESVGNALPGIVTSDDERFIRNFWEVNSFEEFEPIAHGGAETWLVPQVTKTAEWKDDGKIMKRSSQSVRTPNQEWYGSPGLAWNRVKETTKRFGYYSGGLFSVNSFMFFPNDPSSSWAMLAILNSELYRCLALSQTIERGWTADVVGSLPWIKELESIPDIEKMGQELYDSTVQNRVSDPTSPYYTGPALLPSQEVSFFYDHPHVERTAEIIDTKQGGADQKQTITESAQQVEQRKIDAQIQTEKTLLEINDLIYDKLDVPEDVRKGVETEILLRTEEDPMGREVTEPESVAEVPENLHEQVKNLIHHFAIEALYNKDDGIILITGSGDQETILDHVIDQFHNTYDDYSEERLAEVDNILGSKSASDEAYPNIRAWLANDLFQYHLEKMDATPTLWKLITSRLVSDAKGEGFACLVDYHQLDNSLFDRLSNHYLEPRKADLRERRSVANRRRSDNSLRTSEQTEATEAYNYYTSALEQISVFEEVIQDLNDVTERNLNIKHQNIADNLAPKVNTFRKETKVRLQALDNLRHMKSEEWFEDTFSPKFWNQVQKWRNEWIDALEDLEYACEEYSQPANKPVEPHLADLFNYFNWRLKGSDHYSSTGILFMTYYFEREGADFLNVNDDPKDSLQSEYTKHLATLATGLEEYKTLAENIGQDCKKLTKAVPSKWSDRAVLEITTAGYQPTTRHGVAINIAPLADAEIVPKIVDSRVI